ncbi:neurotrypsin-like [Antedon mediterranea]|uniref:neurotrypsin-like n=1 Tax=Antedon mediterranea TaxID=105859 RepID=UPI003AF4D2EE
MASLIHMFSLVTPLNVNLMGFKAAERTLLYVVALLSLIIGSNYSIPITGNIRVIGSLHSNQGVLQIKTDSEWQWFCSDHWTLGNAAVACHQLGFSAPLALHPYVHLGASAQSRFYNVRSSPGRMCTGHEDRLEDCPSDNGGGSCYDIDDAVKLYCSADLSEIILDVRVRNNMGDDPTDGGIVELQYQGTWYPVCDESFESVDAQLVCNQLGYADVSYYETNRHTGYSNNDFILDDIGCHGFERGISVCSHSGFFVHNCVSSEGAWVSCTGVYRPTADALHYIPALFGGPGADEGNLQIHISNEERPVCSDNIGWTEANIACREMGYIGVESVLEPTEWISYGTEMFSINYCHGDEYTIMECDNNWFTTVCTSMRAPNIKCVIATLPSWAQDEADCDNSDCQNGGFCVDHDPWDGLYVCICPSGLEGHACDQPTSYHSTYLDIRLVDGYSAESGRVEVYYNGEWATVCDDGWSMTNSEIVCRQLGYSGAHYYYTSHGNEHSTILLDGVECNGYESNLAECYHSGFGNHDCSHSEDIAVECYYTYYYSPFNGGILIVIVCVVVSLLTSIISYCKYKHIRARRAAVVAPQLQVTAHLPPQTHVGPYMPPQAGSHMAQPQPPAYFDTGIPGPAVYQVPMSTDGASTTNTPNIALPVS